jgi:hypothetical protein
METKPKKELTHDQIEELKARLLKAREAKLNKKRVDYVQNKDAIKEEGLKKRTMKKIQSLVEKGTVKEDELKQIIPKKEAVQQIPVEKIVEEITNETMNQKPLPTKKELSKKKEPEPIIHHKMIEDEEPIKIKRSQPIDVPRKEKDRFMKLVYYKEPSKKTLKKLEKLQESSSDSDSSDTEEEIEKPTTKSKPVKNNDENEYYRNLAKLLYF